MLAKSEEKSDEMEAVEVIVPAESMLVGKTAASLGLRRRYGVNLVAIRTAGAASKARLRAYRFAVGDVVLLQGWGKQLAASVTELGVLPLADRKLTLGRQVTGLVPIALLAAALVLVGFGLVDVEVGFFGAAVLTILFKQVSLKDAYDAIEWPVIVLLGCMIPIGEALKDTGAAALVGNVLTQFAQHLPAFAALGLVVAVAMLLTPLLHHAAAVVVLGPVAAALAANLGYRHRCVPDGRGARLRMRFPDADRAPEQHAGHGAGRLSIRRLLASRPAADAARAVARHAADPVALAIALTASATRVATPSILAPCARYAWPERAMAYDR